MENLGCITFRDTALLVDPDEAARTELERVADVIAHELAHMWFGDLVTMGWWEGIWLNEAFATFMEMLCVDAFRPSWDRWVGFAPSREAALAVDGVHSTRPIEYPVGPPKEAEGMFDLLTYEKGCGVLRMLEQHIGPDVFRDGVRTYLKAHAYGNTVTTDLWDALEDASGAPVRDVMDTFILQGGHPLVSLHGDALSQQPFASARCPPGTDVVHRDGVERPGCRAGAPAARRPAGRARAPPGPRHRARAGRRGRHKGSRGQRGRLGHVPGRLRDRAPPGPGRAPPRAHAAGAGQPARRHLGHHPGRSLDAARSSCALASRLGVEPDPAPWAPVGAALVLCNRIAGPRRRHALHEAVAALIGPLHRRPRLRRRAGRERAHPDAARARHQPPGHRRRRRRGPGGSGAALRRLAHRRWLGRPDPAPTSRRPRWPWWPSCCEPGDYDALLERYRSASTPQEEMRSLGALAGFPDVDLCLRTFDLAMTEVRSQNGFAVLGSLLANPVGMPGGVDPDHRELGRRCSSGSRRTRRRASSSRSRRSVPTPTSPRRAIAFLDAHPLASGPRRVAQSVERLRVNVAFAARERAGLADVAARPRTRSS